LDLGPAPDGDATEYVRRVSEIPPLMDEEEQRLRSELTSSDAEVVARAKKRLIESQLRLAISLSQRYRPSGVGFSRLIEMGNEGLIRALEHFDPASAYRFASYATWWIRQAITRGIADAGGSLQGGTP
jgi:RNA polymerase primary sigma factor